MTQVAIATGIDDPVNRAILAVSEDRISGFRRDPFAAIAEQSGVDAETVRLRIGAMLRSGTIRRVRQTLLATNLARGALVAWEVPPDTVNEAFDTLFDRDPFSGHVVIRSTDSLVTGSKYRLWTTLKVPQGYSLARHAEVMRTRIGAASVKLMPAKRLFALGVGHVRRHGLEVGSKSEELAEVTNTDIVELSDLEWRVLLALKREFAAGEIVPEPWAARAAEAGVALDEFLRVGIELNRRGVIGRFSTFLEHVKPLADGQRVTRFNALFHWAVPPGREIESGRQVGRFHVLTHAYWREGGPEFENVNIMAVAHGTDKELLLAHKRAIDEHLQSSGIPVSYTNVFWGGRSQIKPSEIWPPAYREWCVQNGIDPETMRE
jgi:DNA-binding Lrp family transcriptional regulator